jgi:RNA polymerase sigma factor (sigma-70 family)
MKMVNFEENRKLIYRAIYSKYKTHEAVERIARKYGMDFEDVEQIAAETLYKCCLRFKETGEATFAHYAITTIQQQIYTEFVRRGEMVRIPHEKRKDIKHEYTSLDLQLGDTEETFLGLLPSNFNVEKRVIRKITLEEKMNMLKENERKVIMMKINGKTEKEIAETLDRSKSSVQMLLIKGLKRINPNYNKQVKNLMKEFTELYDQGKRKEEIMDALKITAKAYTNYKYRYNKTRGVTA